jgi:hypothetical protein
MFNIFMFWADANICFHFFNHILIISEHTYCFLQSDRLQKVLEYVNEVHSLCGMLSLDFGQTVSDVHPSLHGTSMEQSTNISNSTLEGLEQAIVKLKLERKARIMKVIWPTTSLSISFDISI